MNLRPTILTALRAKNRDEESISLRTTQSAPVLPIAWRVNGMVPSRCGNAVRFQAEAKNPHLGRFQLASAEDVDLNRLW
jgi:hypothetical protein